MLSQEPPNEFLATIETILKASEKETAKPTADGSKPPTDWEGEGKRVLLK
jgi:hypothetical protein